jgi:hypothetical protein
MLENDNAPALAGGTGRLDCRLQDSSTSPQVVVLAEWSRDCGACGIRFRPRASWHQLCPRCHAGAAAITAIRRASRLLAVRE